MPPGAERCPICDAPIEGGRAVHVADVPILLNVLVSDPDVAKEAPTGVLDLCGCDRCGFVWNASFAGVPYDASYQVDQSRSPRFALHLEDIAARIAKLDVDGGPVRIVEIGCGQGVFLGILGRVLGDRLVEAHGFDPAFRGDRAHLPAIANVTPAELNEESARELRFAPNLVVTRHTIEHIADPVAFLRSVRSVLSPRGPFTIAIETPDAEWTLARGLLHDFCYEHCSLHSMTALSAALDRAGYRAVRGERAFAGEYLFVTAASSNAPFDEPSPTRERVANGTALRALGETFARAHRARLERAERPIAIWGGAGKGALFALLVDRARELIDCVIDIHPDKRGSFLPGTGLPVISPEDAQARGVRTILVANENYRDEIAARCRAMGWSAVITTVTDAQMTDDRAPT